MALDGTEKVRPTPFDAHEQSVRGVDLPPGAEYPKAVAHVVIEDHLEPVIVNSPEEEAAYNAAKEKTGAL